MKNNQVAVWKDYSLSFDRTENIKIADLNIFVKYSKLELGIAHFFSNAPVSKDDLIWHRWPLESETAALRISPCLPDRSILVRPESTIILPKKSHRTVFVRFPISAKLILVSKKTQVDLIELPTVILSKTWFGDYKEGELCYSITSGTRSETKPDPQRTYMAICPLKLKNTGEDSFSVDKICLRTEYFSLYADENQLWTDEMEIIYEGQNETSAIKLRGKAPYAAKNAKIVAHPRSTLQKALSFRTFSSIKDLYAAGISAIK